VGWTEAPAGLIVSAASLGGSAVSGTMVGWIGYADDNRHVATLSQTVIVPAAPVALEWALWIYSTEICDVPWWDSLTLYANGQALVANDYLCQMDTGWTLERQDVSALAGQTVTFAFEIFSNAGDPLASLAAIDNVHFVH